MDNIVLHQISKKARIFFRINIFGHPCGLCSLWKHISVSKGEVRLTDERHKKLDLEQKTNSDRLLQQGAKETATITHQQSVGVKLTNVC